MINSGFANATQLAIHNSLSSLSPKNAPIETFTDVDTEEISKIFENTKEDFQTNLVDEIDASHGLYQPDSLNERLNNLFTKVKEAENIEHLSIEDGVLTVTMDENFKNWQRENKIDSVDDVMMVHCTNFLPKNGVILSSAEGGKIITANITGYDGKKTKETPALLHRNTVHFVLNSAVLSNTGGDWTNTKFVILEPYKYHQDEFINAKLCEADGRKFMSGNSDAYTRQSVKLENPILLVEDSEYDKIKNNPDIANQFSIVKFKGIYSECAKVLLDKLGYPVFNMDPNSGEHFRSNEKFAEKILTDRDRSYNYVCNDEYDGTSNKIVDLNTLNKMYKTFSYNFGVTEQKISDQIAPKLDSKFVTFMTTIKPLDDNSYQFMDDNETLDMIYHQEKIDAESYEHVYELIKFQDSLESNPNASFQVTLSRYDDIDSIMAENPDFQILDRKEIKNQILYTIGLSNSNVNSVEAFQKVESIQDSLKNVKPKPQESYTVSDVFYDREKMRLLGDWVKHNVPENCKIGWVSEELCLSLPYNQKQENMLKLNGIKYEYDESNQKLVIKVSEKNDKIVQAVENIQNIVSKIE